MVVGLAAGCSGTVSTGGGNTTVEAASVGPDVVVGRKHLAYSIKRTPIDQVRQLSHGGTTSLSTAATTTPTTINMTYQNGPLLAGVEVYAVFWGPSVDPNTVSGIPTFLTSIVSSPLQTMMGEFSAGSYTIGNGTFKGAVADDDAPMPAAGGAVTDTDVQAEISRLIDLGKLPANDGKNLFIMFFPPNLTIDQGGGQTSCQAFCGYHNVFQVNGSAAANNVYYAIIPDHGSNGCETGCGGHANVLDNLQRTTSHELYEAITDPDVQTGWRDYTEGGEVGDVCFMWDGTTSGSVVQTEWSQKVVGCRDHNPAKNTGAAVTITGGGVGTPGNTLTFNIASTGKSGTLTLETPDLDLSSMGFNGTFSPATMPVNGGTSSLTITIPTGLRSYTGSFTLGGVDGDGTHYFQTVPLNWKGAAPTIKDVAVAGTPVTSIKSQGGPVTIDGANFGVGATAFICATSTCAKTGRIPIKGGYRSGSSGGAYDGIMPSHKTGLVYIGIINPNDTTIAKYHGLSFTAGDAPTITKVDPAQGPAAGGEVVWLTGTNFGSNATVTVNGVAMTAFPPYNPGTFGVFGSDTIAIIMPAGSGMENIVVSNADGQSATGQFNFGPNSPPEIDHLSLTTGPTAGGQYVTIFGSNFDANATVAIDNVAATMKSYSTGTGFAGIVTPPHAAGMVNLVVTNSDGQTATTPYTYSDSTGGGGSGGTDDGGVTDDGGATDDAGTGGNGGNGGGGGNGGNGAGGNGFVGTNSLPHAGGCSIVVDGNGNIVGVMLILLACLGLAIRRRA